MLQGNSFTIFGGQVFDHFVKGQFANVSNAIDNLADAEILKNEKDIQGFARTLWESHKIGPPPQVDFTRDRVKVSPYLMDVTVKDHFNRMVKVPRAIVRYSVPIIGHNTELLKVCPYNYIEMQIKVQIESGNTLVFEIDSGYANVNFPAEKQTEINRYALAVRDFITKTSKALQNAIGEFNNKLFDFILERAQVRLSKVHQIQRNINNLNPF